MLKIILLIIYIISPTTQDYLNTDALPVITAYEDYTQAVGSELYDAAFQKKVMITPDTPCSTTEVSYYIPPGFFRPGRIINLSDGSRAQASHFCDVKCETSNTTEELYTIYHIPLITNQNIVTSELIAKNVSYVLSLSANSISDGEEVLLTTTVQPDTVLLSIDVSGEAINLLLQHQQQQVYAQLELNVSNQIAILSDSKGGVAFLLNGTVLYSIVNATLTELKPAPPTEVFAYEIEEWKIFDQLLTTQQLYSLRDGRQLSTAPAPECTCDSSFPIFVRWPNLREDPWMGLNCRSVGGGETARRIADGSYIPQFITDGDYISYWLSAKREIQHTLTIDLGADYQIFYSIVTFQTLPKYMVITKSASSINAVEDVLYVFSTDCSAPLPLSLPQVTPLLCQNFTTIYSSKGDERSKQMVIDWTVDILYPDGIVKDQNAFDQSIRDGVFKARYFSLYLYDFEAEAAPGYGVHAINEINVYGSCVCQNGGVCIPDEAAVEGNSSRVYTWYEFPQVARYRCECPAGFVEPNCTSCIAGSYMKQQQCVACACGVGSIDMRCNDSGQCQCKSEGSGAMPKLADDKCRPFVHSITPNYGPVSGGTRILVQGAWLESVNYVYIGSRQCLAINSSKSETEFYCLTPEGNGTVGVHTENTLPIVDFTYKPDPNITAIGRVSVFASGGVNITVKGTNLQSIANPKILVTVICISTGENVAAKQGDCTTLSEEEMKCKSPDLTGVLENVRCGESVRRRKKRSIDINSLFEFVIGFILDGVDDFVTASESSWLEDESRLLVAPNPSITEFDDAGRVKILEEGTTFIDINGRNLNLGAEVGDYVISIGKGSCASIFLYDNRLKCDLPKELPEAGSDTIPHPDDPDINIPSVVVTVGNLNTHVGYVAEAIPPSNLPAIVIPIVVVVLVVAMVVIAVVFIRKKHIYKVKKRSTSTKTLRYVSGPHGGDHARHLDPELLSTLENWIIPYERLNMGKALGQGQFGKVFFGSLEMPDATAKDVAVKTIKAELLIRDAKEVSNFLQEAILMKDFDHPNVLSLIGVVVTDESMPMVITPYMSKGDLKQVLRDNDAEFTIGDLIHFGLQAANGMDYLAKRKFIHRDLAARNCMVNQQFFVKIADFGMSHDIYGEDYYRVQDRAKPLPVKWMSIESLTTGRYTVESDVWSYGVLLWEVMTRGATPYPGVNNYEIKEYLRVGRKLSCPDVCPEELYQLMCECWQLNPAERPRFDQISETLQSFLDENSDYHREKTREIESLYYTLPEDQPNAYVNQALSMTPVDLIGDYDVPEPVSPAPTSPVSIECAFNPGYGTNNNTNNNNSKTSKGKEKMRKKSTAPKTKVYAYVDSYLSPAQVEEHSGREASTSSGYLNYGEITNGDQQYQDPSPLFDGEKSKQEPIDTQPVVTYSSGDDSVVLKPVGQGLDVKHQSKKMSTNSYVQVF